MEGAATSNELDYVCIKDDQDELIFREQETAHFHDPWGPPNSGAGHQDGSRLRANKPNNRRESTTALMHQGFRAPGSCNLSNGNPSTSVQEPRVAVSRRIRSGFVSRSSVQFAQTCKSPSTDSTTSLVQLRDKLTVLSPFKYHKVTQKIATSPELPVLKEVDEFENISSSLPKTKRCGVSLKYYSDSEVQAQPIRKKTGCLPTVVEEHSASLVLVAALDNTNETITNETFEELYRNNPNIDLVDLLVVEALQHGQEKDSGIISGKVTQDSDIVENTPIENVRHKKLSLKQNTNSIQEEPAIDDDEFEVIEDTPCYVFDRKKRVRTNITKASKITESVVTLDAAAVDSFFSQHVNENNTENIISPTLARKMNATSSEASDEECILIKDQFLEKEISVSKLAFEADIVDCVNSIVDKVCDDLDKCAALLAEQERQIDNIRFAKNIDNYSNINSQAFQTSKDKLKSDKDMPYEHNPEDTKKITLKFVQSKRVAPKMNTKKKTANSYKVSNDIGKVLIESRNTTPPTNSTKSKLIRKKRKLYSPKDDENENNEIPNPITTTERRQSNVNETPIATCYRDLENARKFHNRVPEKSRASTQAKKCSKKTRDSACSEGEDPPFQIGKRTSTSSIGSTTTMSRRERPLNPVNYNELDYSTQPPSSEDNYFEPNITKKPKMVRKIKSRRGEVEKSLRNQLVLSPKTRKLNKIFDQIKENVVNDEKITIVEKRTCRKDLLYNLSSESEDGDFKKKKIHVQKRISSSSIDSSATKRRRLSHVHYSEYSSEDEGKVTRKAKTVKQSKPRSYKINKIPKFNLIDERMRVAQQETLETSFVKEKTDANNLELPEPALQQAPDLEVMPPDKSNDDIVEAEVLENKTQTPKILDNTKIKKENNSIKKSAKVTRSTATKSKENIKDVSIKKDSAPQTPKKMDIYKIKKDNSSKKSAKATRSTVTKSKENINDVSREKDSATLSPLPGLVVETERTRIDDLPSSMEANLLQKFKKIYTEDSYFNETNDTRNMLLNADENDDAVLDPSEIIKTVRMSDVMSEKSIATVGRSPITGHNDLNESPPNVELLDEDYQHRDVHNEGMSASIAEFLGNMRNQLQTSGSTASETSEVIPITRVSTKESARSNLCATKMSSGGSVKKSISNVDSNKSNPKLVLTRISPTEFELKHNSVGTPKSKVSVVLTRISSDEVEKYLTPTRTRKSSNTGSPEVVLERISSDDINKWLPMPQFKNKETDEKATQYNTRQTSKPSESNISPNVVETKIIPKISPVKLSFDIVDLTPISHRVTRAFRTRSYTKSMKSHTNTNKEPLKTDSIESSKTKISKNDQNLLKDSQETITTVTTRSKSDNQKQRIPISVDGNKSIASVHDWFKRNATPSSPSAADNNAMKEILCQVMEALQTTLAEIHHATGERFTTAFLKDQEDMTRIEKEIHDIRELQTSVTLAIDRVQEKIATLKKEKMKLACEVLRADAENKARMIKLLQEDIQGVLQLQR